MLAGGLLPTEKCAVQSVCNLGISEAFGVSHAGHEKSRRLAQRPERRVFEAKKKSGKGCYSFEKILSFLL
jgi:hypothetical protein